MAAEPRDLFVTANRLRHHLLDWGGDGPLLLLLHGFLEQARVWDGCAPALVAAGYRVLALDWRGHGDSQWIGAGGYYHFADYIADLSCLLRELGGKAVLIAHSMGGSAAVLYAGTEPERVRGLVSIEGLGPPDSDPSTAPQRFAGWLRDLERTEKRKQAPFGLEEAVRRMQVSYHHLSEERRRALALASTREVDGGRQWKFDPLHRTQSPQPYYTAQAAHFWRRVTCPVLYVEGADSNLRLDEEELTRRLTALRAQRVVLPSCAHHPHVEQPDLFVGAVVEFLHGCRLLDR
jgi:pimeloyl-ACP methyl ester carboxylesterase